MKQSELIKRIDKALNEDYIGDKIFNGNFVTTIPFTAIIDRQKIKAKVLASIRYTHDNMEGIDIKEYDALEITSVSASPHRLKNDAMNAIMKNIENGKIIKQAENHFNNFSGSGPKAAKEFMKPKRKK